MCSGRFLMKFDVFEYLMKFCVECLIYVFNQNKNLGVNREVKWLKFMLIKIGNEFMLINIRNFFRCFNLMNCLSLRKDF